MARPPNAVAADTQAPTPAAEGEVVGLTGAAPAAVGDEAARQDDRPIEREVGPRPCPTCGGVVYWQTEDSGLACAGCYRKPPDTVRKLIVVTNDGNLEWEEFVGTRHLM